MGVQAVGTMCTVEELETRSKYEAALGPHEESHERLISLERLFEARAGAFIGEDEEKQASVSVKGT